MSEKISVIVPVYNCEQYLKRCVNSILNQSYGNIELILVDDGSTDSSGEMCDSLALSDDRVKVLHIENGGTYNARLAGVRQSCGDYISFVDCDDWLELDTLDYLYSLIKSGDFALSACGYEAVFSESENAKNDDERITSLDFAGIHKGLYDYALWSMCAKLYKKELFDKLDGIKISLNVSEDLLTNYYLTKGVNSIIVSNQKKYYYFRHQGSVMARPLDFDRINNQLTAYKMIYDDFDKESNEFCYQAANRLNNDFSLLNQIIKQGLDKKLYDLVRADIMECYRCVYDSRNSYTFGIKHKLSVWLILHMPPLYNLMIKLLK